MQRIATCLWFDGQAEEAARFYCSIFPSSRILRTSYYADDMHQPKGTVLTVNFELDGVEHVALNGGPEFTFSEAISLTAYCETQQEIDRYWAKLLEGGGRESQCGWLKDKFGVSWQVAPRQIPEWISGDPAAARRVLHALMPMVKLDLATLKRAYEGA